MKEIKLINIEKIPKKESDQYVIRRTTRAVVIDNDGLIALLKATKNYFNLPGGGIKGKETIKNAMKRECREEIGCRVKIIKELGIVTEYRKKYNLTQKSYCYIAKVVGKKGVAKLEAHEIDECSEIVWVDIEDAIKKIDGSILKTPYTSERNSFLLKLASKHIAKNK